MLRGILGVSRRDHMRNEDIRRMLQVSPIDEVMRGGRLRWFGHVQRQDANNVTRRVVELAIPGTRRRGRPTKTWHQQIKVDMTGVGVTQDVALDRNEWRRRTRPTTNAAFQSPRANGAHDFDVGNIPVQPYVAFHSRTEPRWLIVLSCSVYYSYY